MSLLDNLKLATEAVTGEEDRLGGQQLFDTAVYPAKIKMAYLRASDKGAIGLVLHLGLEGGKEYTQTIYFTNKDGQTFYVKDGKQSNMPGFNQVNSLCMVAVGKALTALKPEERLQKVRNFKEKKDENLKVDVLVELLDKDVNVAIVRQSTNKQVKQGEVYVPTEEKVEVNELAKFFCAKKKFLNMTATEMLEAQTNEEKTAEFYLKWKEQNEGKVIDRYKEVKGGAGTGAPKAGVAKPTDATDLFGDDD